MTSRDELACVYAALLLLDDDVAITGDKINTILKAAGVEIEPYWPDLFARALEGTSLKDLVSSFGSAAPAAGAAPAGAAPAAAKEAAPAAKEEPKGKGKKEEKKEESEDEDMSLSLFD